MLRGLKTSEMELRVQVRVADLLVQQVADGGLELGRDLLRLVRHVELGEVVHVLVVGLDETGDETDEGGLTRAVLAEQHEDLRVGELARLHGEREVALRLDISG